jgi:hypothetical protein
VVGLLAAAAACAGATSPRDQHAVPVETARPAVAASETPTAPDGQASDVAPELAHTSDAGGGPDAGTEFWRWVRWRPADETARRRGGGYVGTVSYRLINSNESDQDALYDKLFPNRLTVKQCASAAQPGIFAWIYSSLRGSFTARKRRQTVFHVAVADCPYATKPKFKYQLLFEEGGAQIAAVAIPHKAYLGHQIDVDEDGVDELIVEHHSSETPAITGGRFDVVSLRGGAYRVLYAGQLATEDSCRKKGDVVGQVSLGLRPRADGRYDVLEELWRVGCVPGRASEQVGEWTLATERSSVIDWP